MSTQQRRVELLVFGYVNKSYYLSVPIPLIQLTRSYYDKYCYFSLKGEELAKYIDTKNNEELLLSTFRMKGIEFQFVAYCYEDYRFQELRISDLPQDIEYFDFYAELKCETLNYCFDKMLQRITINDVNQTNYLTLQYIKVSQLQALNRVDFNCFVDLKYIKYKKQYKKKDYIAPINKLHKMTKFTWNIDEKTMEKMKEKEWMSSHGVYSDNFDNNNWCLRLCPNGYIDDANYTGNTGIYLQCASFACNANKIAVKMMFVINGKSVYPSKVCVFGFQSYDDGDLWCPDHGEHFIMTYNEFKSKKSISIQVIMEIIDISDGNNKKIEWKHWKLAHHTNDDKLMTQKTLLKAFPIHYEPRYDPYVHPTMFGTKEMDKLCDIVNLFDTKTKGRGRKQNISWRMVKNILNGKNRCRTRFELFQVYKQISKKNGNNNNNKKDKNYDARFVELEGNKDGENKKLFTEPLDFDDKKLTKTLFEEWDIGRCRVIDLNGDNGNKQQHLSHQEAIQSGYNKLNLSVPKQGDKSYSPGDIWKNQWWNSRECTNSVNSNL